MAVGCENWLCSGEAVLTSVTATCKRHGIDPWSYLSDVLTRLPSHSAELLPDAWAASHQAAS